MSDNKPISIASAARKIGVHRSTLAKQVRQGQIRSHPGGLVYLSEVLEDRAANIDQTIWAGRQKPGSTPKVAHQSAHKATDHPWPAKPTYITDEEITPSFVRELGRMIGEKEGASLASIGETLILIGGEIVIAEVRRLKALAGESDPPSNGA